MPDNVLDNPRPRALTRAGLPLPVSGAAARPRRRRFTARWSAALLLALLAAVLLLEARTSRLQARVFSRFDEGLSFRTAPGASDAFARPGSGPYDVRLGHAFLPDLADTLAARGFRVAAQARATPRLLELARLGLPPIYHEKTRAGLRILDRDGRPVYAAMYPESVYASFEEIPELIVRTLLFIENRELLDDRHPYKNPAVEWDRLAKAALQLAARPVNPELHVPGGSTLATQIEKFRHSPEGRTGGVSDKARQMVGASLRAYLDGERTEAARRRIVLDFVNSVPLAAVPGGGEVNGLGDGLRAWYGAGLSDVSALLSSEDAPPAARGVAYRQVLSLFIAHRRPTTYLLHDHELLEADTDRFLRLLAREGVITPALFDGAMAARPGLLRAAPARRAVSFVERKGANAIRTRLLQVLPVDQMAALDRLDLTVTSTIDGPTQARVTALLERLHDPAFVDSAGLRGFRLLERGDPRGVVYSFTLYERAGDANVVRVQADTYDQPLDINEGMKLDLGSTAKLRTLIHYLEVVAALHGRLAGRPRADLLAAEDAAQDRLTRWAAHHLATAEDTSLAATLEAAMERSYSASPDERFFTGGGIHTFANFDPEDDRRILTVREGIRNSVNLVFIRLMRDIVGYHVYSDSLDVRRVLADRRHPARNELLARFADREGREFLAGFYKKHHGKTADERLGLLLDGIRPTPRRVATILRSVRPDATPAALGALVRARVPGARLSARALEDLYAAADPEKMSLADRGYVARVHPLELWLVAHLEARPDASWNEVVAAGAGARQDAYAWLFDTRGKAGQDRRIRTVLEEDAFEIIHAAWQRLGYPFGALVPSYATAIGSSADRPAALAELVGILLADGERLPVQRIERLHMAEGTPFETLLEREPGTRERVLPSEVAAVARRALVDIVERGTAGRASRAFPRSDGAYVVVGGKTGTGDHRFETFDRSGRLLSSRVMNRTATFVFFAGDRFFGVVSAYVAGPEAAGYGFTSSLPVQVFRTLAPALEPLIEGGEGVVAAATAGGARGTGEGTQALAAPASY